jgi:hypothetical protein
MVGPICPCGQLDLWPPVYYSQFLITMSQPSPVSGSFGNVPNAAESFGTIPNSAEEFRTLPQIAERKESHTLTVREVARMFESAGVARTERSIINWCQPNKLGVSRLDAYFDPNERRYFITPQSVELAIKEEQAKTTRSAAPAESDATIPKAAERRPADRSPVSEDVREEIEELKRKVMNLTITDRVKEQVIKQYEKDRAQFAQERKEYIEQLMTFNRQIGEMETQLLQLNSSHPVSESN